MSLTSLLAVNRPSSVSKLPHELWREIFQHATYVRGGYDTLLMYVSAFYAAVACADRDSSSSSSPFDFSELTDGYTAFVERLKISHSIKQAIQLVSQAWRALSSDLILEYLFLRDNFSWSTLAEGLENTIVLPNSSTTGYESRWEGHGAGWYVKRVEISASQWTDELARDAARVLRACPNLQVVSVGSEDELPVPHVLVSAVLETCPQSLRALDWTCGIDTESLTRVLDGIGLMKELRTLFLCVEADTLPQDFPAKVSLPKLHTLELVSNSGDPSDVLITMADWNLPALRQVTITGQADLQEPGPFFWTHGHKLRTLEFDYAGELQVPPDDSSPLTFDPTCGPELLFRSSPDLSELVLSLHWAQLQASPGHANVQCIGLRGLHLLSHKHLNVSSRDPITAPMVLRPDQDFEQKTAIAALDRLFPLLLTAISYPLETCINSITCLNSMRKYDEKAPRCHCRTEPQLTLFPRLRVVRLLDFDQARFGEIPWRAKRVAFWRIWVKRFEEKGVRLEDHKGELVRVNFNDVSVYLPEDEREYKKTVRDRAALERRATLAALNNAPLINQAGPQPVLPSL